MALPVVPSEVLDRLLTTYDQLVVLKSQFDSFADNDDAENRIKSKHFKDVASRLQMAMVLVKETVDGSKLDMVSYLKTKSSQSELILIRLNHKVTSLQNGSLNDSTNTLNNTSGPSGYRRECNLTPGRGKSAQKVAISRLSIVNSPEDTVIDLTGRRAKVTSRKKKPESRDIIVLSDGEAAESQESKKGDFNGSDDNSAVSSLSANSEVLSRTESERAAEVAAQIVNVDAERPRVMSPGLKRRQANHIQMVRRQSTLPSFSTPPHIRAPLAYARASTVFAGDNEDEEENAGEN